MQVAPNVQAYVQGDVRLCPVLRRLALGLLGGFREHGFHDFAICGSFQT